MVQCLCVYNLEMSPEQSANSSGATTEDTISPIVKDTRLLLGKKIK